MKSQILIFVLTISLLFSCENQQETLAELDLFLESSYLFNTRTLNKNKADYYTLIQELPSRKIEKLNQLDEKFEVLISEIDSVIIKKESDLSKIIAESKNIFKELPKVVENRKDYLLPKTEFPKIESNEISLKFLKNRLVIGMAYAFEYGCRITYSVDGLYNVKVDNIITKKTKNGVKLTLTSKYGQTIKENRHIIINSIELNGKEENIDFELKDNHSFKDIDLDSLQKGKYKLNGILRFYHREQKFDIPFEKEFKVE